MGMYLNPGKEMFLRAANAPIYVDKTELLAYTNTVINTTEGYICVSRPRRFGKSIAANMVAAYYDRTAEAEELFAKFKIAKHPDFAKHLGKYDVVKLNIQDFVSRAVDSAIFLEKLQKRLLRELIAEYPGDYFDPDDLTEVMADIFLQTKRQFVIVIDEWDAVFRDPKVSKDWQRKYLDFMRWWLKDKEYVGLVYMTGIFPIRKCGTHSALNMFSEFTAINPNVLAEYVGFNTDEVRDLCRRFDVNFDECRIWYDGYYFDQVGAVYNPRSVVAAMLAKVYDSYWNKTETFEALKIYIDMDFDGLREAIIALMAGVRLRLDVGNSARDMGEFYNVDDILAMLITLGYLGYDFERKEVFIPNQEIRQEFSTAVQKSKWNIVADALKSAEALLDATVNKDSAAVAMGIEAAHLETSHLQYNDENALAYTISLAYYTARQKYLVTREFPAGKGFADMVFLPRPLYAGKLPAIVLELKWNKSAKAAIAQIKAKNYPQGLKDFAGEILLVGINYDKETRKHECEIEVCEKFYAHHF